MKSSNQFKIMRAAITMAIRSSSREKRYQELRFEYLQQRQ